MLDELSTAAPNKREMFALLARKYVRITERRPNGMVAFDFAIGSPEIFVELMMPKSAFENFCRENCVVDVTDQPLIEQDFEWRLDQVMKGE